MDLSHAPVRERAAALRIQLRAWSPFAEFDEYVVWRGARALVWLWDAARLKALMAEAGVKTARAMPESVLHPPLTEGLRLVRCLDGVEGQHWREGILRDSHWWPDSPTGLDWRRFQRSCGAAVGDIPAIETLTLLPTPWGRHQQALNLLDSRYQRIALFGALALLGGVASMRAGTLWKWLQANQALEVELAARRAAAEPVLQAREQAVADQAVAERLARLSRYPRQLELKVAVSSALTDGGQREVRFLEWLYSPGKLEVVVEDANAEPRRYVTVLQNLPMVAEATVQAERGSGRWRLTLALRAAL